MATPRVTIDQLPIQAAPEDTNEIIIQDSGVTKRLSLGALRAAPSQPLLDHIADIDDAHDASAISATASNPNVVGANVQLQLGELAVLVDGKIDQTIADGRYVNINGDTMTGPLILVTDPTGALEAATKQYVDNSIMASSEGLTEAEADALYVNVGGDTMVGALLVPATPTSALDAVPKQYVDDQVALQLTQAEADALYLKLVGGTLTGALTLNGALQNHIVLGGTGPAHQIIGRHSTTLATIGYLSWNDAGYARLAADPGAIYLRCGTTDMLTVGASSVSIAGLVYCSGQVRGKGILNWNAAKAPTVFGLYNNATDETALGTRTGYFGTNTGSDDIWINNEIAAADIKIMPGASGGNTVLGANNVECVRVTGSSLLVWKAAANTDVTGFELSSGGQVAGSRDTNGTNLYLAKVSAAHVAGGVFATFRVSTSQTQIGSITEATTSTTAYNTGSDGRFKENVVEFDDELAEWVARIVQPVVYNWIDDPAVQVGYIAQTVAEAWPGALDIGLVTPADPDDAGSRWMMDHSKLVPVLHAAWQSSARKVEALTARLDAVEAKVKNL